MDRRKKTGEERRQFILDWLKKTTEPLTGQVIAEKTNVSRQIVVQDISLLKARNEPVMATSQGYVYLTEQRSTLSFKKIIACRHVPKDTERELLMMVDHGVTVRDVSVEHPIYGELTATLMIKNRRDVIDFIKRMDSTNAAYLSDLTEGVHLHTIEADTEEQLSSLCQELEQAGFLLK